MRQWRSIVQVSRPWTGKYASLPRSVRNRTGGRKNGNRSVHCRGTDRFIGPFYALKGPREDLYLRDKASGTKPCQTDDPATLSRAEADDMSHALRVHRIKIRHKQPKAQPVGYKNSIGSLMGNEYVKKSRRNDRKRREKTCHTFATMRTLSNVM